MSQLPTDCINDIFEYLEDDNITLRSCLLVNHLWCEVAVRILWRNVWNYSTTNFSTLIASLPNESKEILLDSGIVISTSTSKPPIFNTEIIISTPTSKPPIFNYASFCKVLSVRQVHCKIKQLLRQLTPSKKLNVGRNIIVEKEIYKLFMSQISSLELFDCDI